MSFFGYISQLRRDYNKAALNEKIIDRNPFVQFKAWFDEMMEAGMLEPTAFVLSTASSEGQPSSRVLLLKKFDERGFVFFTNYESRKGTDLAENPKASILFFWDKLEQQVRIEGTVEKISPEESDEYYQTRPYTSRLGAWASMQSRVLSSRFTLIRAVAKKMMKYPSHVPLPPYWGGYRLIPETFEFWQGRESRLHDRMHYRLDNGEWVIERLYP